MLFLWCGKIKYLACLICYFYPILCVTYYWMVLSFVENENCQQMGQHRVITLESKQWVLVTSSFCCQLQSAAQKAIMHPLLQICNIIIYVAQFHTGFDILHTTNSPLFFLNSSKTVDANTGWGIIAKGHLLAGSGSYASLIIFKPPQQAVYWGNILHFWSPCLDWNQLSVTKLS